MSEKQAYQNRTAIVHCQDAECLGKVLELNLGMGLSQRQTATIYS